MRGEMREGKWDGMKERARGSELEMVKGEMKVDLLAMRSA
jgi:hypothetical protein